MLHLVPTPADAASAHELLAEYFALRAEIFPGGGYVTTFPDPAVFVDPKGVFLVGEWSEDASGEASSTEAAPVHAQPVAIGGIRRVPDGPAGTRYEVKHLYVRPIGRGRGWGRAVLEDLEARARAFGAAELVLDTHHSLEAAGGLYAASGFTAIEPYNDNPNATRWYGKLLA